MKKEKHVSFVVVGQIVISLAHGKVFRPCGLHKLHPDSELFLFQIILFFFIFYSSVDIMPANVTTYPHVCMDMYRSQC